MDLRMQIKQYARDAKVPMWMVAREYGISDSNFSRMLRYDERVTEDERRRIYEIIDKLAAEQ